MPMSANHLTLFSRGECASHYTSEEKREPIFDHASVVLAQITQREKSGNCRNKKFPRPDETMQPFNLDCPSLRPFNERTQK